MSWVLVAGHVHRLLVQGGGDDAVDLAAHRHLGGPDDELDGGAPRHLLRFPHDEAGRIDVI